MINELSGFVRVARDYIRKEKRMKYGNYLNCAALDLYDRRDLRDRGHGDA